MFLRAMRVFQMRLFARSERQDRAKHSAFVCALSVVRTLLFARSEREVGSEEDVELPVAVDTDCPICNCKKQACLSQFASGEIDTARMRFQEMSHGDRQKSLWERVLIQVKSDGVVQKNVRWSIDGKRVCKPVWAHANYAGHSTIDRMKSMMANGHAYFPERLPKLPAVRNHASTHRVDSWFLDKYQSLAEPFPFEDACIMGLSVDEPENILLDESSSHPAWILGINVGSDKRAVPKRYLNPGTLESLWRLYQGEVCLEDQVGVHRLHTASAIAWLPTALMRHTTNITGFPDPPVSNPAVGSQVARTVWSACVPSRSRTACSSNGIRLIGHRLCLSGT